MTIDIAQVESPIGAFRAVVEDGYVRAGTFQAAGEAGARRDRWGVHDALAAYFAGDVHALEEVAVQMDGTAFQLAVWKCLREIRAGETRSYGEVAELVGVPHAARAVGMANAANPVGLIVPCHRVIRAGGALGGYGFGVETKRWLLDHEEHSTASPANGAPKSAGRAPIVVQPPLIACSA
jgi:methylated-DNA-[protein]-cysteine S-methyltransferase